MVRTKRFFERRDLLENGAPVSATTFLRLWLENRRQWKLERQSSNNGKDPVRSYDVYAVDGDTRASIPTSRDL